MLMRALTTNFLLILACGLLTGQPAASLSREDQRIEQARLLVQRELEKEDYPGIAVAVSMDGKLIWSEGFGFANLADSIPVDPARSLFRVGSISKTLTAAAIAVCVEKYEMDLDVPIQTYVPYFPQKRWPITTEQVGRHIAGIRHYGGFEFLSNVQYHSVQEALGVFMHDTLLFEP